MLLEVEHPDISCKINQTDQLFRLQTVDPDLVVGGPGLAYWLQTNPTEFPDDQRVSGTYFAEQVSNSSLPLNFFSFHAIAACTDSAACNIASVSFC